MRHPIKWSYKIHCASCGQTWTFKSGPHVYTRPPVQCGFCGSRWIAVIDIYEFAREFAKGLIKQSWRSAKQ